MNKREPLYFVSRNSDKFDEYKRLLTVENLQWSAISVDESQSMNLEMLTDQKLSVVRRQLPGVRFFVEHTGLLIHAWGGLPGGITKAFLDRVGNEGLCRMMSDYKEGERRATARVVIGYSSPFHGTNSFFGEVAGTICEKPRGAGGFGWDPIFVPDGDSRTFAEMHPEDKHRVSMRHDAARRFRTHLETEMPSRAARVFVSYAREDHDYWKSLRVHLAALERRGIITLWSDQDITGGASWRDSIQQAISEADVFLLLVSAEFVASDFCMGPELQAAMAAHHQGTALVVPVLLREIVWKDLPFEKLQVVPTDATPVEVASNRDHANVQVVRDIEDAITSWGPPTRR